MMNGIVLGIETGGTKIVARLEGPDGTIAQARWPTTSPDVALDDITSWIGESLPRDARPIAAGIAAFGPLIVDPADPRYGEQLTTPKPGWAGANLQAALAARLGIPVVIDTDVNAAARAELALGAGRGRPSIAYLTIGTGIGAGLASSGGTLKGAMHPEVGHLRLVRADGDMLLSACPFHGDCAEGLAAGPALQRRLGGGFTLDDRPDVRALAAAYIAQLCVMLVHAWSPHRIVMGGGVGTADQMITVVRDAFARALGDYGVGPAARAPDFIVPATLDHAGLEGALLMANDVAQSSREVLDAQ